MVSAADGNKAFPVEEHLDRCFSEFRSVSVRCQKGMLTEADLRRRFEQIVQDGFFGFLFSQKLCLLPDPKNRSQWERFTEDLQLHNCGALPCCKKGDVWLAHSKNHAESPSTENDEASPAEKDLFFSLMEAFQLPPDYFRPVPLNIPVPDTVPGHFPSEHNIDVSRWVPDGCLPAEFRPGAAVTLTDRNGLKAVLRFTGRPASEEERRRLTLSPDQIAIGSVEGYTAARKREINVYLKDDRIALLKITDWDADDNAAFINSPLWQDWHAYTEKNLAAWNTAIDGLIRRFSSEP